MNKKDYKITEIILKANAPVTSGLLSEQLDVSSRTIKRAIWVIDEELKENGASVLSGKNGYEIEISDRSLFDEYWKKQERINNEMLMENEIELEIMKHLFLRRYCTQDEISDEVYISRSTINKYVRNIKDILAEDKVELGNRPHFGYFLQGKEEDIRNLMVKLFFSEGSMANIDESLRGNCRDFVGFIRDLERFFTKNGFELNDRRTISIMKYFVVVADRVRIGCTVDGFSEQINMELNPEIHELMEKYYGLDLDEKELSYLSQVIGVSDVGNGEDRDLSFYDKVVDEFLSEIKEVYQQNFLFDPDLRKGLVQHLYSCYSRMLVNTVVDNPLLDIIKTKYVEAYNYAVLCGNILHDCYDIDPTEDSLGYIALHFAAAIERMNSLFRFKAVIVCDSGFGMSELLKMTITNRIKNIDIERAVSTRQLYEMNLDGIALVITSVKLDRKLSKPVIFVDSLKMEGDIDKIDSYLKDYINIPQYKSLFSEKRFYPLLDYTDKEELLNFISEDLLRQGVIRKENADEFIRREKMSTTEINSYVAIPHCIVEANNETALAIATLKKPLSWGKEKVCIVLAACIARKSTLNRKLFPLIYKLTIDEEKCQKLAKITSYDEFIELLFSNLPVDYGEEE